MTKYFADKSIRFHVALHETFDDWASVCGQHAQSLQCASEHAIRTRHHEATIDHEAHRARGNQPDILTLSLGSVCVFYTIEPNQVMIRGYGWELNHTPADDFDGGGFYAEASW